MKLESWERLSKTATKKNHFFHDYFFLHIHKTAGSAIKTFFGLNGIGPSHHPLDKKIINSNKIITSVRNPYDRAVSTFKYRKGKTPSKFQFKSFEEYVKSESSSIFPQQVEYLKVDGEIIDPYFVFRFENLKLNLEKFIKQENLKYNIEDLQVIRPSKHMHNIPYQEFYTKETQDIIYNLYKEDFEYFNYDYKL